MQAEKVDEIPVKKLDFKNLHFIWFVGQFLVFVNGIIFFLSMALFHSLGLFYRVAYLGVLISYGIVLYNSYKPFNSQQLYFKKMLMDENTQYFLIALYFLFTRRIAITLLPFVMYSTFHVNDFGKNNLIPCLPASAQTKWPLISTVKKMDTGKLYEQLMPIVSKIEIYGIMTRLILGLFVFRSSLFSVILYAQFLHMRYYMSPYTRQILTDLGLKFDQFLTPPTAHPKVPSAVINVYAKAKEIIFKSKASNPTTANATASKKQS
ncbi:MAG: hypothetical protein EXX96DRAFT_566031 [Benjaminiella poitrasii]|nr:MAG: hypothetical protein EXX96DRAFT_566031 [Benjaminiella poitrasii]